MNLMDFSKHNKIIEHTNEYTEEDIIRVIKSGGNIYTDSIHNYPTWDDERSIKPLDVTDNVVMMQIDGKLHKTHLHSIYKVEESYDKLMNPSQIYDYINELHQEGWEKKPFEDKEWIMEDSYYRLENIELNDDRVLWNYGQHLPVSNEYANIEGELPPIVVSSNGHIIDGTHRVGAAKLRGDTHLQAYLGYGTIINDSFTPKLDPDERDDVAQTNQEGFNSAEEAREELDYLLETNYPEGYKNLPDNIYLYRLLFIDEDEKIDIDKLGEHWVMDPKIIDGEFITKIRETNDSPNVDAIIVRGLFESEKLSWEFTLSNNLLFPHEYEITAEIEPLQYKIFTLKEFKNEQHQYL